MTGTILALPQAPDPGSKPIFASPSGESTASISFHVALSPVAGTARDLHVETTGVPGVGERWRFRLLGSTGGTMLECAVEDTDTTCDTVSDSAPIVAGEKLVIRIDPTGAAGAPNTNAASFGWRIVP
jgi:hypothetical protein